MQGSFCVMVIRVMFYYKTANRLIFPRRGIWQLKEQRSADPLALLCMSLLAFFIPIPISIDTHEFEVTRGDYCILRTS